MTVGIMTNGTQIIWFDPDRIPKGSWPFLLTIWDALRSVKDDVLLPSVDLTEGLGAITITGRLEAYRQLILRRALDLAQSTVVTWNSGLAIGAVISARALLETLAAFHNLLEKASCAVASKDWETVSQLVDAYAMSSSDGPDRTIGKPEGPPAIGKQVRRFLLAVFGPRAERFWHQISDMSHPNGRPMLRHLMDLGEHQLKARPNLEIEAELFPAVYNCLYAVCWFYCAMSDFDKLLDRTRYIYPDDSQ